MLKLKLFVTAILLSLTVGAGLVAATGQELVKRSYQTLENKGENLTDYVSSTQKDSKVEKIKEPPKEIKIPEARTDKVQLFQEQSERVRLEQQLAIEKFKASPDWKALEDRQKQIAERLVAELSSALRAAGVEEKDFDKYTYDQTTLTFKRKVEEPKK